MEQHASETTITILNKGRFSEAPFLLPPLAEQKRIVAMVEKLLARVKTARERLAKVPAILKRFRQSVLAAACSGRLTADWRDAHPDIEPASKLLDRILVHRRRRWDASLAKRRATRRYVPPEPPDASGLDELADTWTWANGEQLFEWSSGKFLPKKKQCAGPYPVYGGNGISGYHGEFLAEFPTLVVGRVGALCGNVYATEGRAWVTDNAIYATYVPRDVHLHFMRMVFDVADLNAAAGGSGQPFVNQTILNQQPIPLPPLGEQHEIVRRVEGLFKLADTIEQRVTAGKQRADKLTQAVLAKAFRGELVPTEAELARREGRSYEPASALLERLRVEREREVTKLPRR